MVLGRLAIDREEVASTAGSLAGRRAEPRVRLPRRRAPAQRQPRRAGRRAVARHAARHVERRAAQRADRRAAVPRWRRAGRGDDAGDRASGACAFACRTTPCSTSTRRGPRWRAPVSCSPPATPPPPPTAAERAADADRAAVPVASRGRPGSTACARELDELHIRALERPGARARACGRPARRRRRGRPARARRPVLEAAHRLRIAMLGRPGDRAGALKAYERCKALLAAELGIEPSAETEAALQRRARGGRAAAPAPEASSPFGGVLGARRRGPRLPAPHRAHPAARPRRRQRWPRRPTAPTALALLETSAAPDVIVCDIDMPGMDGVEFIRHVAERRLASAVAIASGLDRRVLETVRAASEGYGLQVLGAVEKPLTARGARGAARGLPAAAAVSRRSRRTATAAAVARSRSTRDARPWTSSRSSTSRSAPSPASARWPQAPGGRPSSGRRRRRRARAPLRRAPAAAGAATRCRRPRRGRLGRAAAEPARRRVARRRAGRDRARPRRADRRRRRPRAR